MANNECCMEVIKARRAAHGTTLDYAARNGEYAKALDAYIRTKELEELLEELEGRPEDDRQRGVKTSV